MDYIVELLYNQEDLMSYAKAIDREDPLSTYLDATEDLKKVRKNLDAMTPVHKERIEVYLFSDLNQTEMADRLKTKQPNIKRNFIRSMNKLLDGLE